MQGEITHAKTFCNEHIKFLEQIQELVKKFMINKEQFIFANSKQILTHYLCRAC